MKARKLAGFALFLVILSACVRQRHAHQKTPLEAPPEAAA